ncbi:MAG TPA: exosortase A, partial [Thermoleophilia bacterium]|nr:exosortase A [Thermoleophilia bacterium]
YSGALATFLLGAGWLLAHVAGIQVMKHFFTVAMVPALVWALQGAERVKVIVFPLCFLLFAVPAGEALIPPLIDFTAAFTVTVLRVTGIPVYIEGNILRVPTGVWSIEAACSGVRYLIASVTLGCLYAYLAYHSFWRRAVFIAASAIVPIFANGFRAYMIVMIGHLSGMRLAVGVDHFIYGWVFFGVVVALLFWLGSFWRDEAPSERRAGGGAEKIAQPVESRRFLLVGVATLAALSVWPLWAKVTAVRSSQDSPTHISLPETIGPWSRSDEPEMTSWKPRFVGADTAVAATYQGEPGPVQMYLAYYAQQQQGSELVNSLNALVGERGSWRVIDSRPRVVSLANQELKVREALLGGESVRLLVWQWYWIDGRHTSSPYFAKLLEARALLLGHPSSGASIVLGTAYQGRAEDAASRLGRFVENALPLMESHWSSAP